MRGNEAAAGRVGVRPRLGMYGRRSLRAMERTLIDRTVQVEVLQPPGRVTADRVARKEPLEIRGGGRPMGVSTPTLGRDEELRALSGRGDMSTQSARLVTRRLVVKISAAVAAGARDVAPG